MSDPIGTYTFLPWIRHGIANRIAASAKLRATIDVQIDIEVAKKGGGTAVVPVPRKVELYGPGDIVGIERAQISRVEPQHWVTNFEPNYLASIEFYDEDFPWRYTPAGPNGKRLLPWLALVVLEEGKEFAEGGNAAGKPLSYIDVTADFAAVFPDAAEGWAWAHAHFNADLSTKVIETDAVKAAQAAQQVIDNEPDTACSRLLCPRKLKPKTGYHAFLIPAFETGRLAGLGRDPKPFFDDAANALTPTSSSWAAYAKRPDTASFPVYHRWYFRTAEEGDFESLVRLLKPKVVNSRVGHRDMDVTRPAPNIAGITKLDGELRLGGALKAPFETLKKSEQDEFDAYDRWATPYPQTFQTQLAAFVNLADSYQQQGSAANADPALHENVRNDPDPLITPPIYGRWHALTERLLQERDGSDVANRENWVHDLNLDPRWRTAAGFGTKVVQKNQETYMEAAWDQIGDVLEANRRIRQAQLAKLAGKRLHRAHVRGAASVSAALVLLKAAPMKARIVSDGLTVHHRLARSPMTTAMTSSAMRRMIRPGGRIAKRLGLTGTKKVAELIERANEDEITAAPEKTPPEGILTPDDLAGATAPASDADRFWARAGKWLREHFLLALILLLVLLLLIALLLGFGPGGLVVMAAVIAAAVAIWMRARRAADQQAASDALAEDNLVPETVDTLPASGGFTFTPVVDPLGAIPSPPLRPGETDSADAVRFKLALRDELRLIATSRKLGEVPRAVPLDLPTVAADIVSGTRPELTVPRWTWSGLTVPPRIREQSGESFVEVMAYPELDTPMCEPLIDLEDKDAFVPNLHLVEPDSVTLLETNQKFIEAYMVGLNHELARELLWREYPTDQRGSYFRQFWDVRKKLAEAVDKKKAREELKDIKELHRWPAANDLGENDNREVGDVVEEELVLVVRGELFKKYPNTVVTAQPARWRLTNGKIDKTKERELDDAQPQISPLYEARVAPDIYFFGFDLTAKKARGNDKVDDKPGWFFRIQEVPGDARFGFDISREAGSKINVWNDLAWADVVPALADGKHIKVADIPSHVLVQPTGTAIEKKEQWDFDKQVPLDANVSSAELAYIALQTPVIMAVHASELLPDQESGNA